MPNKILDVFMANLTDKYQFDDLQKILEQEE